MERILTDSTALPQPVRSDLLALLELVAERPDGTWEIAQVPLVADTEIHTLEDALYSAWYTAQGFEGPAEGLTGFEPRAELAPVLDAAVAGAETFQEDWIVAQAGGDGILHVIREQAYRQVGPGEYVNAVRPGVPPAPGEAVEVLARNSTVDPQSGFWVTTSIYGEPKGRLVRFYLNPRPEGLPLAIHLVTNWLWSRRIRFSCKSPDLARGQGRADRVVLYLEVSSRGQGLAMLEELRADLEPVMRANRPPLTRELFSGVAVADDPGSDVSFGSSRCRALAAGLLAAAHLGALGGDAALNHLVEALEAAGIDPAQPWTVGHQEHAGQ